MRAKLIFIGIILGYVFSASAQQSNSAKNVNRKLTEADSLKIIQSIDSAFDLFWSGKIQTSSKKIEQAINGIKTLSRGVNNDPKLLNELAAKESILSGFMCYLQIYYEGGLKIPRYEIVQKIEGLLKANEKINRNLLSNKLSASLYLSNGLLKERLKRYDEAKENSEKALTLFPDWAFGNQIYADICYFLGDFEKSETHLKKSIDLDSTALNSYYVLGWLKNQQGFTDQALLLADKLLMIDSTYFMGYNLLSYIFDKLGKTKESIEMAIKALQINKHYDMGYSNLSYTYQSLNQYDKAKDVALKGIAINKYYGDNYWRLSRAYKYSSKKDSAKIILAQCMSVDSTYDKCYEEMGDILYTEIRYDEAIEFYKKAIKFNKYNDDAYADIGYIYLQLNEYLKALPFYEKAFELNNTFYWHPRNLAIIYANLKRDISDRVKAIEYFELANQLNPSEKSTMASASYEYSAMANYYIKKDSIDIALEWLKRGARNGSQSSRELALAIMYENGIEVEKDYEMALKLYQKRAEKVYGLNICLDAICRIYEKGLVKMDSVDYKLWKGISDTNLKKFTIPCNLNNGGKLKIDLYIYKDYPPGVHPIEWEAKRIREEFNATVPQEVMDSFWKLFVLAKNNNVSFPELCVYAINAANESDEKEALQTKRKDIKNESNLTKRGDLYKNLSILYEDKLKKDSTNKELKTEASSFFAEYADFLFENHKQQEGFAVLEKISEYYHVGNKDETILKVIKKIDRANLINQKTSYNLSKFLLLCYLQNKDSVSAALVTSNMLKAWDTPKTRDEIHYYNLLEEGTVDFNELFITNASPSKIKEYWYYFSNKSISKESNILKRVHYANLINLDEEYLKADSSQNIKIIISQHYNSLAWYCLLTKKTQSTLYYLKRSIALNKNYIYPYSNLPHAYLFNNDFEKAKGLYVEFKDIPFDKDAGFATFKEAFLADFDDFEKEGITHEKLNEIKELLKK